MQFNQIQYKKPSFKIKAGLREHLKQYSRLTQLSITYEDLMRYQDLFPLMNKDGEDTYWYAVIYSQSDMQFFHEELLNIYEELMSDGEDIPHLRIESIEFCSFGNSQPFRIKVVNELNDNHDYFYIKKADASRVYGLELEDIFSPNKVSYLVDKDTLVENHTVGIPCDEFIKKHDGIKIENRLRFAKEFVKFNERCFVQLLGDMRAYNFVVEITQDFDNIQYRLRAIDFDQQSYEGKKNMYLPQFFKENIELVHLAQELISESSAHQYMKEERVAMRKRFLANKNRTKSLLRRMKKDKISQDVYINSLKDDLAAYHHSDFSSCRTMGDILEKHLELKLGIKIF